MTPLLDRMRRLVPYAVALAAVGAVTAVIGAVEERDPQNPRYLITDPGVGSGSLARTANPRAPAP